MLDTGNVRSSEASTPSSSMERRTLIDMTPSMTERLKQERDKLAARLQQVDTAIAVIESNPQVQAVIDALTKLNWVR